MSFHCYFILFVSLETECRGITERQKTVHSLQYMISFFLQTCRNQIFALWLLVLIDNPFNPFDCIATGDTKMHRSRFLTFLHSLTGSR